MLVMKQALGMKVRHLCAVLWVALFAMITLHSRALSLPELTSPVFTDTEVSTNVSMMAWSENTRQFNVTLQFDATPSNNVQVALGIDELNSRSRREALMPRMSRSPSSYPTMLSSCY